MFTKPEPFTSARASARDPPGVETGGTVATHGRCPMTLTPFLSLLMIISLCEVAQRAQSGQKEVGAAAHRDKLRQTRNAAP